MLVSFSVSNFRSFDEEQTFSLVASKRHSNDDKHHLIALPKSDDELLRTAVIYGANGAGKSNLFKALKFLREIAVASREREEPLFRDPFLLRRGDRLSTFDVYFFVLGTVYRYGVKVDDASVIEEWLLRVSGSKETTIFSRITSTEGKVEVSLGESLEGEQTAANLEALATIGGPRNQSFMATAFATLLLSDIPRSVSIPLHWFIYQLQLIDPKMPDSRIRYGFATNPELMKFAGEFLRAASTGIEQLAATETPLDEDDVARILTQRQRQRLTLATEGKPLRQNLSNGDSVTATRVGEELNYKLISLEARHLSSEGDSVPFEIDQESDGTQRLLQLLPALHVMSEEPKCFFIDEIDRSLHPMLVQEFLSFFLRSCHGQEAQLIMTTHESNLLDQDLLRRDEIWFAEKDTIGATRLYSLLDYNPRNDMQLRKNYLQGRFGAVPFLGGIERLLEKEGKVD